MKIRKASKAICTIVLFSMGLMGCAAIQNQKIITSHEDDYIYTTNPPFTPVSKIPPGSLLSQRVSH